MTPRKQTPAKSFPRKLALDPDRGRESRGGAAALVCPLLVLVLMAAGCGRAGPPRAADLVEPVAISDLTLVLGDRNVKLGWSHPRTALDGQPLTDFAGFVVYRKSTPADCPDCNAAYGERAVVSVEDEGRFFKKSEYEFTDTELQTGRVYRYRVRVRLSDGSLSRPSNEVSIEWQRQ